MGLFISTLLLTFIQILIYPLINLLFTPINLITLGTLKSIPWLLSLFLFDWLSVYYVINPITIPQITYGSINTPSIHLGAISTIIFFAIVYSLLFKLMNWLVSSEKD
jgi:hypothetical protein